MSGLRMRLARWRVRRLILRRIAVLRSKAVLRRIVICSRLGKAREIRSREICPLAGIIMPEVASRIGHGQMWLRSGLVGIEAGCLRVMVGVRSAAIRIRQWRARVSRLWGDWLQRMGIAEMVVQPMSQAAQRGSRWMRRCYGVVARWSRRLLPIGFLRILTVIMAIVPVGRLLAVMPRGGLIVLLAGARRRRMAWACAISI